MAASNLLRRFGFKKSEPRESEARIKLQKELFSYNKCVEHGFPHKPTALAYDPKLKIMAIGTKSGALRIYGKPGVEFSAVHPEEEAVNKIFFLPEQARLITQCSNNTVYLWEINSNDGNYMLEQVRSFSMEASKLKTISACCVTAGSETLLMGTEGGNIHMLDTNSFKMSADIIYQDVVMQNVPDDFKVNPGAVESIAQCPTDPNQFLIGYNRGLIVLWDSKDNAAKQTYNASQQLESLSWNRNGTEFMSAHADGSYIIWLTSDSTKPKEQATTPYGPFPCKAITNVSWKSAKADSFIIFTGGMPRASYGDRHTLTMMQGVQHAVFDFTSRVVDFVTLCNADEHDDIESFEYDDPHSILVLAEEEVVAIDLQSEGWQSYRQPYLNSLHSSAITSVSHASNVPEALWNKIVDAGEQQFSSLSTRDWPIFGGQIQQNSEGVRELLLTGHEDGSVRFWDSSSTTLRLMYKLTTAEVFGTETGADIPSPDDEEWPPFKKVGTFDPYSDDPRLAVQKVVLCSLSETLVIGGTAGQVVVFDFSRESRDIELDIKSTTVNVISDRDNYSWKGHKALPVNEGDMKFAAGFQPMCVMQLQPPAAITALTVQAEWQLVAAGTAHGYGVFDYNRRREVFTKCTLSPQDLSGTGESQMSRRKSFKKSLRESFRRLRTRRSQRAAQAAAKRQDKVEAKPESPKKEEPKKKEEEAAKTEGAEATAPADSTAAAEGEPAAAAAAPATIEEGATAAAKTPAPAETAAASEPEPTTTVIITSESPKPVERQVESRQAAPKDDVASMVRVLTFADTFLANAQTHTPTLFAGTNLGTIFCHEISVPASDKRESDEVTCTLRKELQLQHRAPVIYIALIDRHAQPLPAPLEVTNGRAKAPDMTGAHQLVIVSEEQFKIFTLPTLKASIKYKLTAHEGSKVRRVGLVNFRSKSDERYNENDLAILTNCGDVQVFSVPQLRKQIKADAVRKENVNGIACSLFTQNGEGFFLGSPSEFVRFSVSARFSTQPACAIEIKDGVRPPPPEPEPEVEAAATVEETPAAAGEGETAATATTEGEEGDKAVADTTAAADQSTTEPANDSIGIADTTIDSANMTVDSVRLHNVSESRTEQQMESGTIVETSRTITSSTRIVKTTIIESMGDGDTTRTETVTVQQESSDSAAAAGGDSGDAAAAAGVRGNLDDDTKLISTTTTQPSPAAAGETTEPLAELHITEEGDSPPPTITVTPASPLTTEDIAPVESTPVQSAPPPPIVEETVTKSEDVPVETAPPPESEPEVPTIPTVVVDVAPDETAVEEPASLEEVIAPVAVDVVESAPAPILEEEPVAPVEVAPTKEEELAPVEEPAPVEEVVAPVAVEIVQSAPAPIPEEEPVVPDSTKEELAHVEEPTPVDEVVAPVAVEVVESSPAAIPEEEPVAPASTKEEEHAHVEEPAPVDEVAPIAVEVVESSPAPIPEEDDIAPEEAAPTKEELAPVELASVPVDEVESATAVQTEECAIADTPSIEEEAVVAVQALPRTPVDETASPFAAKPSPAIVEEEVQAELATPAEEPQEEVPAVAKSEPPVEEASSEISPIKEEVLIAKEAPPCTPVEEEAAPFQPTAPVVEIVQEVIAESMPGEDTVPAESEPEAVSDIVEAAKSRSVESVPLADEVEAPAPREDHVEEQAPEQAKFTPAEQVAAEAVAEAVVAAAVEEAVKEVTPAEDQLSEEQPVSEEQDVKNQQDETVPLEEPASAPSEEEPAAVAEEQTSQAEELASEDTPASLQEQAVSVLEQSSEEPPEVEQAAALVEEQPSEEMPVPVEEQVSPVEEQPTAVIDQTEEAAEEQATEPASESAVEAPREQETVPTNAVVENGTPSAVQVEEQAAEPPESASAPEIHQVLSQEETQEVEAEKQQPAESVVEESVANGAAVQEQEVPAQEQQAPAQEQEAPAQEQDGPAQEQQTPAQEQDPAPEQTTCSEIDTDKSHGGEAVSNDFKTSVEPHENCIHTENV